MAKHAAGDDGGVYSNAQDVDNLDPKGQEDSSYSSTDANQYARSNYGSQATGAHARKASGRKGVGKKVAIGIGCVILALVVAVAAYLIWFSSALDRALAPEESDLSELNNQLKSVPIDQPFYILLLGSDSREGSGSSDLPEQSGDQQRSDVMMLVRIDAPKRVVTMVSISRDTPYMLDDGRVVKINEAYNIGGAAESIKAVSKLTGVDISHYAEVRVSELEAIVDAVGGVDVYVDRDLSVLDTLTGDLVEVSAGQQTLNGKQAQVFARARHEYDNEGDSQDAHRQSNVRELTMAIARKVLNHPINEMPGVILDVAQYVTTDLKSADLVSLGISFAKGPMTMYSCSGPTDGDNVAQYDDTWLCYQNPEGWAELIRQVETGQEPGDIDFAATQILWNE